MTLIVQVPRVSYTGDGVNQTFATVFTFEKPEEVTVWRGPPTVVDCCDAPTYANMLQPGVDYYWLPGDYLTDGGSLVVLPTAAITAGELITLMRTTPPDQPEAYGNLATFTPQQVEFMADRITRMIQELYHNPFGVYLIGGLAYDWKHYVPDTWPDSSPLDVFNIVRGLSWAANFAGAIATVEAYDTLAYTISIQDKAHVEVGTLHIPANSGALTWTTSAVGGLAQINTDQLRMVPPAGGLGNVLGLAWTIPGSVTAG